jgi:Zn finger protein HypA/HybF involved in hydrogenase expression
MTHIGWHRAGITAIEEFFTPAEAQCECANCDWSGPQHDLRPIKHYWSRVDEADAVEPDGECPDCGCLAYAIED